MSARYGTRSPPAFTNAPAWVNMEIHGKRFPKVVRLNLRNGRILQDDWLQHTGGCYPLGTQTTLFSLLACRAGAASD